MKGSLRDQLGKSPLAVRAKLEGFVRKFLNYFKMSVALLATVLINRHSRSKPPDPELWLKSSVNLTDLRRKRKVGLAQALRRGDLPTLSRREFI